MEREADLSGKYSIYRKGNLTAWAVQDGHEDGIHFHEEAELLYVLSGRVAVYRNNRNAVLFAEQFTFINPFEEYELYLKPGCHILSFCFSGGLLKLCGFSEADLISPDHPEKTAVLNRIRNGLARLIKGSLSGDGQKDNAAHLGVVIEILAMIMREFGRETVRDTTGKGKLAEVLRYIHQNYEGDCSLGTLAEKFFLSPGHLSRLFLQSERMHCSEYVRNIRLAHGAMLLRNTERRVVDIAIQSGFSSSNSFSTQFRSRYGVNPQEYRKQESSMRLEENSRSGDAGSTEKAYLYALLKYVSEPDRNPAGDTDRTSSVSGTADAGDILKQEKLIQTVTKVLHMGYAAAMLYMDSYEEILKEAVCSVPFRYVFNHAVFDEAMHVVYRDENGAIQYDFRLLDRLTDMILRHGCVPYLELSRTPAVFIREPAFFFAGGYIQLPDDLEGWCGMVRATLRHFSDRYGEECVREWRFALLQPLYMESGMFSLEGYMDYYKATFQVIREEAPGSMIGGGTFDISYLQNRREEDGCRDFSEFLSRCKDCDMLPDFLTPQDFAMDFTDIPGEKILERVMAQSRKEREAMMPSTDPDRLIADLKLVKNIQKEAGTDLPVEVLFWNSTFWSQDLGNDTGFKAAYIARCFAKTAGLAEALCFSAWYDESGSDMFEGGNGAVTSDGIPKAAARAVELIGKMESCVIGRGEGWIAAASPDRERITILFYHYGHYNRDVHLDRILPREEQLEIDRYYAFDDPGSVQFTIDLTGMEPGYYDIHLTEICRGAGSAYDIWRSMGMPKSLNREMRAYLIRNSLPRQTWKILKVRTDRKLILSELLGVHTVKLLEITRNAYVKSDIMI